VISGDENRRRGLALGAMSYLEKSVTRESLDEAFSAIEHSTRRRVRKLLLVATDAGRRAELQDMLGASDLQILESVSAGEALAIVRHEYVDGIVVDTQIPGIGAVDLVREIQAVAGQPAAPVVLYGETSLSPNDAAALAVLARSSVVKQVQNLDRLLDETTLLLHRPEAGLSDRQREILADVRGRDETLTGKKVLVVDDDLRNIFALTSILEQHMLQVVHAENGRAGIETLKQTPDIDAVLMDVMMPEMDGYETTRAIRQIPEFRTLPIIALTAKAMKGDRDKCLEAGASDYVPKPVDLAQLFSVLRVWIARGPAQKMEPAPKAIASLGR
jgi:CheY-like chemotaxis protein